MLEKLDERARQLLLTNDKGGFTVPTSGLYPYQWNWDSALVALGFATFDESRACREIETLFEAQWADGFVPHIIFRRNDPDYFPGPSVWQAGESLPSSGITQPPVVASVMLRLWHMTEDADIRDRLAALVPMVMSWHRWFHRHRVLDGGGVIITHPWESGRDNSPEWDEPSADIDVSGVAPYERRDLQHADAAMRPTKLDYDRYIALVEFGRETGWDHGKIAAEGPFRVADVGMTFILLRATRDLLVLAKESSQSELVSELEDQVRRLEGCADLLWDDNRSTFCSRDVITGRHSGHVTSASFLYAYADIGSDVQRREMSEHFERLGRVSEFMLPSYDAEATDFDDLRYWRGPVWIIVNYMVAKGFEECGLQDYADRIRTDSARLIAEHGFREAFSPVSGTGTGGDAFSWTAAMWLSWCRMSLA